MKTSPSQARLLSLPPHASSCARRRLPSVLPWLLPPALQQQASPLQQEPCPASPRLYAYAMQSVLPDIGGYGEDPVAAVASASEAAEGAKREASAATEVGGGHQSLGLQCAVRVDRLACLPPPASCSCPLPALSH
jgi:hypothetical protein